MEILPVYIPSSHVCHMDQYHCCKHRSHCRLYPICSQIQQPTVCQRNCAQCTYQGCSLSSEWRISRPIYIQGTIQGNRTDLDLEGRYQREKIAHKDKHRRMYVLYNTLFGNYREQRNAQNRKRYWSDPEYYRMLARKFYKKRCKPKNRAIEDRFLPSCGLQCSACEYEDCILPANWLQKAHQHAFIEANPDYFANYRKQHTEERRAYDKRYYQENREKILERIRTHRADPAVKQQRAKYDAQYRKTHRDADRERHRRYYARHKEEINARKCSKRAEVKSYRKEEFENGLTKGT